MRLLREFLILGVAGWLVLSLAQASDLVPILSPPPPGGERSNSLPRVILSLKDGSKLMGRLEVSALAFQSPLAGEVTVALARLRSITWPPGESNALLTFFNGDQLQARPTGLELHPHTIFGECKLRWSMITQLQVDPSSVPGSLFLGRVHRWSGEEDARDSEGNAHGQLVRGAAFAPGVVGKAFSLDGSGDHVVFPAEAGNFGTNDFTLAFWMRPQAEACALLAKRPDCNCDHLVFWDIRGGRNQLAFAAHSGAGDWVQLPCEPNLGDAEFHHVAVSRQGRSFALYLDGILKNSTNSAGLLNLSNTTPLQLGLNPCVGVDGTVPFKGQLDEIVFFDRSLSAAELEALVLQQKPKPEPK